MPEDTEFLTPDDVERIYRIKKGTQAAMRSLRQIPFIQVGPRMPRYRRADLEGWLTARSVSAVGAR